MNKGIMACLFVMFCIAAPPAVVYAQTEISNAGASLSINGFRASERGDYETAFSYYLAASKLGDSAGMLGLEWIYRTKKNDPERAYLWCTVLEKRVMKDGSACIERFSPQLSTAQIKNVYYLAIQCLASRYLACEEYDPSSSANSEALYAVQCVVADPTGTPMNIRKSPRGQIVMVVENNAEVVIIKSQKDDRGKEWALINSMFEDYGIGWVFREFLKCGLRKDPPFILRQNTPPAVQREQGILRENVNRQGAVEPSGATAPVNINPIPVSLLARQQPRSGAQADQCQIWTANGYPIAIETCSYSSGGSGYYKIINNSAQPVKICWSIVNAAGKKDRGCNSNLGIGSSSRSSCFDCGVKNGGAREVVLESYETR